MLENGQDNTPSLELPRFEPYLWVLHRRVELPKKKEFERGKFIDIAERIIYGWTNSKQFQVGYLLKADASYYPDYLFVQHNLQRVPEDFRRGKEEYLNKEISVTKVKNLKCLYEITATGLSQPDQVYFGAGMANGTTSVWSTSSLGLLQNTRKHEGSVTAVAFFEGWKVVTGSSKGEVNIDNLQSKRNEVSRTNVF